MVTPQVFQSSTRVSTFVALAMTVCLSTSAHALDLTGDSYQNNGNAARGIQELCAPAVDGIARQPEAGAENLSLVEECEDALDKLGKSFSLYEFTRPE